MKTSRKAVTPVIATIILIAGTLVLAFVVGAYAFALSGSNLKTTEITSAILTHGDASVASGTTACSGANFQITFNNPGIGTFLRSITLTSGSVEVNATYYLSGSNSCGAATYVSGGADNFNVPSGANDQIDPFVGATLTIGATYSYVITLANWLTIPGAIIAQ